MSEPTERTQIFGLPQAWRVSKERQGRKLAEANAAIPKTAKLSDLQRQILEVGLRWRGKAHADFYMQDIKVEVFGLEPGSISRWRGWRPKEGLIPGTARFASGGRQYEVPYGQMFNIEAIGKRKYNSLCASISRALKRIEERKLIVVKGPGRSLTDHGLELVRGA